MKLSNIPNIVTVLRILLVFPVLASIYYGYDRVAFYLFMLASISDGIDGFLARRFNWQSRFGSIADPLADKFLMVTTFLMLTYLGNIPLWLLATIVIRDAVIVFGGIFYHYLIGPYKLAPSFISKLNTLLQFILIVIILFQGAYFLLYQEWIMMLMSLVFMTNIISLIHYVWVWSARALRSEGKHE